MKKLMIVTLLSGVFMTVEIVGGIASNSIALISDAAHLASDTIGLGISVCALSIAQKAATENYSYGFHRVEVLGALISILSIWILTVLLVYEATLRFYNPPEIGSKIMFGTAVLSLFFNLIQIYILHTGEGGFTITHEDESSDEEENEGNSEGRPKRNINVQAAYLHVLGDMLNSIGVIVAATVILIWPSMWWFDPICTYLFSIIVFSTTFNTFGECIKTFLEGSPTGF